MIRRLMLAGLVAALAASSSIAAESIVPVVRVGAPSGIFPTMQKLGDAEVFIPPSTDDYFFAPGLSPGSEQFIWPVIERKRYKQPKIRRHSGRSAWWCEQALDYNEQVTIPVIEAGKTWVPDKVPKNESPGAAHESRRPLILDY